MTDKHLLKLDKMPTVEEFMSNIWTSRLDYVGLVKKDGGGGVNANEVFYNFTGSITKLKVKIENPGNYGLGYIDGDISADKPTIIDWGNGKTTTLTTPITNRTQANNSTDFYIYYSEPGEYEISIDGWCDNFKCCKGSTIKSDVTQIGKVLTDIIQVSSLITNFDSAFKDCLRLTSIPDGLFDKNTDARSFYSAFSGCSNLTSIPDGLFDNNTVVTDFVNTFFDCKSLKSIPYGLFNDNTKVTSFGGTFQGCSSLTGIPSGLFDNNTEVIDFGYAFAGCSSLTSIPSGLFDNNVNVTSFRGTFSICSKLASIPSGLFDNNVNVTSFRGTFSICSKLASIPSGLFDENTKVTNFSGAFQNCSGLTSIPEGLFDENISVTSFSYTFSGCLGLKSIPTGLFDKNTKVTDFQYAFNNCENLTGETPYTWSSDGKKIKPWQRDGTNGFAKPASITRTFYGCTNLTDFEAIPNGWKY